MLKPLYLLMLVTLKLGWQKPLLFIQNIFTPQLELRAISFWGGWLICLPVAMRSAVLGPQDTPDIGTRQLFSEATSRVHVTGWGPGLSAKQLLLHSTSAQLGEIT